MAGIGAGGTFPGNMRRDLLRAFCPSMALPKPVQITVDVVDKHNEPTEELRSVLNPCEMLESMRTPHRDHFHDIMGVNPRQFWSSLDPDDPKFLGITELMRADN